MDVQVDKMDGVLTLTMNRPSRKNALTTAMYTTMAEAMAAARDDKDVRAIVIRGTEGIFSSGNDVQDFLMNPPRDQDAPVFRFLKEISTNPKPIVAAVSGVAVGIGLTMLLHCDLVYADETARFSVPFVSLGVCPEAASSLLLPRLAGYHVAAEKLMLGEAFDAQEAFRAGVVNKVVPAGQADTYAYAQALKLTGLPAASLRVTKSLLKKAQADEIEARMGEEAVLFAQMLAAPESREAMTAFMEKRKPNFRQFD
jgi:enoyl-CoA hydratase/carnithine racemase